MPSPFDDDQTTKITHGSLPFGDSDTSTPIKPVNPFDLPPTPVTPSTPTPISSSPFDDVTTENNPFLSPATTQASAPDQATAPMPEPDLPLTTEEYGLQPTKSNKKILAAGLMVVAIVVFGGVVAVSSQLGLFRGDNRQRAYEPDAVNVTNAAGEQITAMAAGTGTVQGKVCGNTAGGKIFFYNMGDMKVKFYDFASTSQAYDHVDLHANTPYIVFFQPTGSNQILGHTDTDHKLTTFTVNANETTTIDLCDTSTDPKSVPTNSFSLGD